MHKPTAAGKSSYDLINAAALFTALPLREGMTVVDLACGRGDYAMELAARLGVRGRVYAVDLWPQGIEQLRVRLTVRSIDNVLPMLGDISKPLPLEDACADLCLMATVLHDLIQDGTEEGALSEAARLLKTDGTLAVVEFRKIDSHPGPPVAIRLAPEELEDVVGPCGFAPDKTLDLGPYLYLSLFTR